MQKIIQYKQSLAWLLAGVFSFAMWLSLRSLEASGEIEGPEFFVNTVLWAALFFSVPLSMFVFSVIQRKLAITRWFFKIPLAAVCFVVSFFVLALSFFVLSEPLVSFVGHLLKK